MEVNVNFLSFPEGMRSSCRPLKEADKKLTRRMIHMRGNVLFALTILPSACSGADTSSTRIVSRSWSAPRSHAPNVRRSSGHGTMSTSNQITLFALRAQQVLFNFTCLNCICTCALIVRFYLYLNHNLFLNVSYSQSFLRMYVFYNCYWMTLLFGTCILLNDYLKVRLYKLL